MKTTLPKKSASKIAPAKTEQKLQEISTINQKQFENVLLHSPNIFIIFEGFPEMIITFANEPLYKSWGKTVAIIGKPLMEVVPEIKDQTFPALLQQVFKTGKTHHSSEERALIHINGNPCNKYYNYVYQPIFNDNQKVTGVTVMATDITELVFSRKTVEESETLFRLALFLTAKTVFKQDAQLKYTWIYNTHPSFIMKNLVGKTDSELMDDDAAEILTTIKQSVLNTGITFMGEVELQIDDKLLDFTIIIEATKNNDGIIDGIIAVSEDITERKLAQEKLAYRTALLEAHNEASIDGLLLVDTRGKILSFNQRFVEIWNIPQHILNNNDDDAALSFAMNQLVNPEQFMEKVKYSYNHPSETSFDELKFKDGKIIERNGYAVVGIDGTYYACSWTFKDITERKRTEQDLKNTKEQLELTFKNIPAGVYLIDAKGKMVYVNDRGAAVYGDFTPEYMLENNDLSTQLKIADKLFERFDENGNYFSAQNSPAYISLTTGKPSQAILKQINKVTRQQKWYYIQGAPLLDEKGNVSLVLITTTDITKQKQASQYARSLIESSLDPFVTISADGKITDVNEASIKVTGVEREKLIDTDFSNYFTEPEKAQEGYQQVFEKGFVTDYPLTIKHKNGNLTDVLYNASVYKDNKGNVLGVFAAARDVTERNVFEKDLIHAKVSAENATKSKQQFLSNMSHEIRTPLNSILGFTNVLLKTELDLQQKEFVDAINTSGKSLNLLINDILDLAKVDAGKMTFETEPFEIRKSTTAILHSFDMKIKEKNLELVKEYDKKIPSIVVGDSLRLNQIILNLISNAVKFTHKGKIKLSIKLLHEDKENVNIEFVVSDSGIGIAGNKLNSIFNLFEQAEIKTSTSYGGTGLGLSIVKQLVEGQGGSISVKSKLGEGSTFSFTLSFGKTNLKLEEEIVLINPNSEVKTLRVLVAEDVALNQLLIKIILNDFGFKYEIVGNGKLAIEKMQTNTFDIILMDLQMPEMNGCEATEYIRKTLKSQIPIIALTADVTTMDISKCKEYGMDSYISKPIDEKLLYIKIVELVKKNK